MNSRMSCKPEIIPVISETIRTVIDQGLTTARELADIAGINSSTVSRYQNDEPRVAFDTVNAWVRHHPNDAVKQAFYACLPAPQQKEVELDINGDGKIDIDDIFDGSIKTCQRGMDLMAHVRGNQSISGDDAAEIELMATDVKRAVDHVARVAASIASRRRKCQHRGPLKMAEGGR